MASVGTGSTLWAQVGAVIAVGLGGLVLFLLLLLLKKRTAAKETLKTFASFELLLGAEISTLARPLHPLSPSRPPAHGRMRLPCVRPRTRAIWSAAARTESRAARCV